MDGRSESSFRIVRRAGETRLLGHVCQEMLRKSLLKGRQGVCHLGYHQGTILLPKGSGWFARRNFNEEETAEGRRDDGVGAIEWCERRFHSGQTTPRLTISLGRHPQHAPTSHYTTYTLEKLTWSSAAPTTAETARQHSRYQAVRSVPHSPRPCHATRPSHFLTASSHGPSRKHASTSPTKRPSRW